MKLTKILVSCMVACFAFICLQSVRAETDVKALQAIRDIQKGVDNLNQIQTLRVKNSIVLPSGAVGSSDISANAVTGGKLAASVISQIDTYDTTTTSVYTATSIGQILFGKTSSSARVWRASALTATNWVQVYP